LKYKNKKTIKTQFHFKFFIAALFFTVAHGLCTAQSFDGTKTVNKISKVPGDVTLQMNNQSGDIKIYTSGENSVTMKTTVEISGNSKEEVDKVIAAIEKLTFELNGNTLEIDTRFYKSMNTINNKSTMTLLNGDEIKIKDFKIRHELHIPKTAKINLNNKYSDIDLESLDGDAEFVLYSSNLNAENFAGKLNIEAKYSKIKLENIGQNAEIDFYDTNAAIVSCENMKINSKYSKYEIKKAGELVIESYDDKFNVENMSSLKFTSKYSDFVSQANANEISLQLYDCNVKLNSAKKAVFNGKYCELHLGDIENLRTDDSYDNNVYLGNSGKIEIAKSKYSLYEIESISNLKLDDVYDDNIKIEKLNTDFIGLSMNGKYGKLEVNAGSVPFKVQFKIKYPKVDIPESVKISKQIKDNSNLELVGGESGGIIEVEGYDMKVVIDD